jgi:diaminopimelate epimerase
VTFEFTKMNGAGNDFVVADNRDGRFRLGPEQVARLCHRQRGIGADGLMLLVPCASGRADWAWDFFNSDGSHAEMCGNGARCFARFIQRLTGVAHRVTFETAAGVITAGFEGDRVAVGLTEPHGLRLNEVLEAGGERLTVHSLNTGVPHAVVFVDDADRARVQPLGSALRFHPHFAPRGTNVNFVELLEPGSIRVRTYERGVEGETLACGTGVTASALIAAHLHDLAGPVRVRVQGGDTLEVGFVMTGDAFKDVRLTGPADFVFDGRLEL